MPEPQETAERVPQRQHNEDRVRRADAWLERSRQKGTEDIERFIFLWIAFNAAYGNEAALQDFVEREDLGDSESHRFRTFLRNIVEEDRGGVLESIVWDEFSGPIRVLLSNRYVFRPFWKAIWGSDRDSDRRQRFESSKRMALTALSRRDVSTVLSVGVRPALHPSRPDIRRWHDLPERLRVAPDPGRQPDNGLSRAGDSRHYAARHRR